MYLQRLSSSSQASQSLGSTFDLGNIPPNCLLRICYAPISSPQSRSAFLVLGSQNGGNGGGADTWQTLVDILSMVSDADVEL